jgi:hypothetical protein
MSVCKHLNLLLAAWLCVGEVFGGRIAIPCRVDPAKRQVPDDATVVFWQFEKGDASDATRWSNTGEIRGKPTVVPDGKFGKCLSLQGGQDGVLLVPVRGLALAPGEHSLTAEFWLRFEKHPEVPQCLFELAAASGHPAARLDLLPGGKLALSGDGLTKAVSEGSLAAAEWLHIAIVGYTQLLPRGIGAEYSGATARVNGRRFVTAVSEAESYIFPPASMKEAFCLGNSLASDAGFAGRIDEFRLSCVARSYYEPTVDPWLDPDNKRPLARSAKFFRDPEALLFNESFDAEETSQKLRDAYKASRPEPSPGSVEADLAQPADEKEATEKAVPDTFDPAKTTPAQSPKVSACPGVKGRALQLEATAEGVVLELPPNTDLASGTVEFWFRPCDWDNFTLRPHRNSQSQYLNSRLHLLTVYGKPKNGEGEAQPLVKLVGDRLRTDREAPFDLHPYHWTHAAIVWGKGAQHHQPNLYIDGKWVEYDLRVSLCTMAEPEVWQTHVPAYIRLGNLLGTAYDELRVMGYPFFKEEVQNAFGTYTGSPLQELGAALVTFDYRMSAGKLSVQLAAALKDPSQAAGARVAFTLPHENRTLELTVKEFVHGRGQTEWVDVGELPEGDYACRGALVDKAGKELGRFETPFRRAKLPWLHNRLGLGDSPPAPFTPVTVDGRTVRCVERQYSVAPNGLFDSIVVRNEEILHEPVHFELVQAGRETRLEPADGAQFGPSKPVEADWQAAVKGGGLSIRSMVRFEYDGMAKYELELAPLAGEVTVDRLSMRIPLKEKHAEFIHVLPRAWSRQTIANRLPCGAGMVWDSKTWTDKYGQQGLAAGNFMPMVWLGGHVSGFCWFADNDKGWVPGERQPALTVARGDGCVGLGLHFISEPYALKEPRTIIFGLLATPPKPLPDDCRLWNRGNNEKVGVIGGRLTSCEAFAGWDIPPKGDCFDFWPKDYDWGYAEMAAARQRVSKNPKYGGGKAHLIYQIPTFIPLSRRDGDYFQWEWFREGGSRAASPFPPSKVDCLVWYMNEWFRRNIMDGIYLDGFTPAPDYNHETGTAYLLPDGRIQPGNAFFGYRDYIKRLQAILHSLGKPPLITAHSTNAVPIPLLAFASVHFDGEDVARFRDPDITFMDAWSLDRLMTLNSSERTSLVSVLMLKGQYATRGRNPAAWAHMVRRTERSTWAIWLLFDMNVGTPPGAVLGEVVRGYFGADVKVLPFWRNEGFLTVEALLKEPVTDDKLLPDKSCWTNEEFRRSIGHQPLRATLYQKPDRALLVVANFLRKPVDGRVRLNFDALGVPKGRQPNVTVRDIDDWPEAQGYDIQRMGTPRAEEASTPPGEDKEDDAALGVADLELEGKKDRGPRLGDGVVTLEVREHDFRAVEALWDGPEDGGSTR